MISRRAIIFDIDDTLYPECAFTFSGYRAVAAEFAQRFDTPHDLCERMQALFDTPDRNRVFNVIVEELRVPDAERVVTQMIRTFRTHRPEITMFPDAANALKRLMGRHKLGAISDGYLVTQQAKVEALQLRERFDAIILTDEWGREFWKPHPRAFEEIARQLHVSHSKCVYVADNRAKDFVAPNALGWHTVFVDRPGAVYREAIAPSDGLPATTIESLDRLETALNP